MNNDIFFEFISEFQRFVATRREDPTLRYSAARWVVDRLMAMYPERRLGVRLWNQRSHRWERVAVGGLDLSRYQDITEDPRLIAFIDSIRWKKSPVFLKISEIPVIQCPEFLIEEHIRELWIYPLYDEQKIVMGVLALYWRQSPSEVLEEQSRWENVAQAVGMMMQWVMFLESQQTVTNRMETLLAVTEAAVLYIRNGTVAYANDRFLQLWLLERKDLSRPLDRLMRKMSERITDGSSLLMELSAAGDWDHVVEMKGMPPRYIRCRGKVLTTDASGQAAEHVAVYTEITEEVAVKKERDAFLSLIAHEFRTPITIIVGLADWMTQSGEDLDPQVAHNIRVIWRESDRLGRLIREIWTVAQMQAPDFTIKLEPVDMVALIQEELETQERLSPGRSWRYTGLSHAMVSGHQELLLLIIQILLSNANRFSPAEHPIDIDLVDEGDMVRLAVADRGPGISRSMARELFHRVPDSLHRPATGGIGLGLYLSKRILDKMGGSITYQTRPNGGSVFLVRLPRAFSP
ncbi:MAG: hypothetical protein C7B46_02510 [Sulfobacillus benefaciens]|uniref:histidine kinase n=1 Tax=Sulfobacillus benefaciens TaxID=453960 RepID=A0A2T2XKU8_9FIRM|nr:MAG: hypothetical protein C7B46_02510 [Sulfobacillus benefaciens]